MKRKFINFKKISYAAVFNKKVKVTNNSVIFLETDGAEY